MIGDGKRAAEVIGRIRALATKGAPVRVRLRPNDIVADAAILVAREVAAQGVALALDLAPGLPEIAADKVQLQQVVINLLVNAIQAMAQAAGERRLAARTRRCEDGVAIEVDDSGPGIPAEAAKRIFDAFYTTKEAGMGMGLSICRTLVEAHGGTIALVAKAGPGALFHVTLPIAGAPSA
jgi:signal transduction histidine kinase